MSSSLWARATQAGDQYRGRSEFLQPVSGGGSVKIEYREIWPSGERTPVVDQRNSVRDPAGAPYTVGAPCALGGNADVAELRTLIQRLLEEKQALLEKVDRLAAAKLAAEEANRAKSEFLTVMSHELRTPLNAVLGFAQLLEGRYFGPLNDKQTEYVGAVFESGTHLAGLIDDILELSRIETGKLTVSVERIDASAVVRSVAAILIQLADKEQVFLDPGDFGVQLPALLADRVRLAQVLINFGTNAIKYNRASGSVRLGYEEVDRRWARISFTDTGIGIPDHRKHELFEPFNRLDAAKLAIGGSGVGLALSRRLIELMGGRIGFTSTQGVGSCFWVDLPIADAEAGVEEPCE